MNWPSPSDMIKHGLLGLIGAAVAWAICAHESTALRPPLRAEAALHQDPLQTPTSVHPFRALRGGQSYDIEPVFNYEIAGLLVELHDSDSWNDMTHRQAKDFLNTRDLCLIWGENLKNDLYRRVQFSHGDWTCYFQSSDSDAFRLFRQNQFSNNHVLPADETIAKEMKRAEIGDQIQAKGWLVNYKRSGLTQSRNTSTVRDDTGNGACEIIWVNQFQILRRGQSQWREARDVVRALFFLALIYVVTGLGRSLIGSRDGQG